MREWQSPRDSWDCPSAIHPSLQPLAVESEFLDLVKKSLDILEWEMTMDCPFVSPSTSVGLRLFLFPSGFVDLYYPSTFFSAEGKPSISFNFPTRWIFLGNFPGNLFSSVNGQWWLHETLPTKYPHLSIPSTLRYHSQEITNDEISSVDWSAQIGM